MRLATVLVDDVSYAARLDGEELVILPFSDVGVLLALADWESLAGDNAGFRLRVEDAEFAPVIPHPNKIVCLGLNYATHIKETGRETPEFPTLFAKYDGALTGPYSNITIPVVSDKIDWEAELTIVIGKRGRDIPRERALHHVAGYTVASDVSVRDYQRRSKEYLAGKTFEAMTPLGPYLVTADELPPGASGLRIATLVDDEVMQDSNTADLLFTVEDIIEDVSKIITLVPGDVILTGTPGGVGNARQPKLFLRPGQVLTTFIEGIGELRNEIHE